MARPVVKWAAEPPCASEIPFYLERAYAVANTGRKGAVHLTIPVDLFANCSAGGLAAGPIAGGPITGGKTAVLYKTQYFGLMQGVLISRSGVYMRVNEHRRKQHNAAVGQKTKVLQEVFKDSWLGGRVVMQRPAKPWTPVRFRPQPL